MFPVNAGWLRFRSVAWAGPLGQPPFGESQVWVIFIDTYCYVSIASNHPSDNVAAPKSLQQNSWGYLYSHSSLDFTLPLKSTRPSCGLTPCLGFLSNFSLLSGFLASDYRVGGHPPSLVSRMVGQVLWWWNTLDQVQIMAPTWNRCPQSLQVLSNYLVRKFLDVSRFLQTIPLWHSEINSWGM